MRIEVTMPNLGYDMEAGKVKSWLKEIGDSVERGEPIALSMPDDLLVSYSPTLEDAIFPSVEAIVERIRSTVEG